MVVELLPSRKTVILHIDGFLFYKHSGTIGGKVYWECKGSNCKSTAITVGNEDNLEVVKGPFGPKFSHHEHAPNHEEVNALKHVTNLKRTAEDHPEVPPAVLIRNELRGVSSGKNWMQISSTIGT